MRWLLPLLLLAALPACSRSGLDGLCAPVDGITTGDERVALAAVDDLRAYWFRTGAGLSLRSAPRCQGAGGASTTLTTEAAFRAVAIGGDRVFFVDGEGTLRAVPRAGGPSEVIAAGASPIALLSRPGELLWMTATGFFVLPLGDGGQPPASLGPDGFAGLGSPREFRADESALYWLAAAADNRGSAIYRMARADRSVTQLVSSGLGPGSPTGGLALDSGELYYAGAGGQVLAVPVRGGTPRLLASFEDPEALALSVAFLWWRNPVGSLHPGLRRLAKAGGAVSTVAAPPGGGNPLADVDAVWVDDG